MTGASGDSASREDHRTEHVVLRLYVAGSAQSSVEAITNVKAVCREFSERYDFELQIVDVYTEPRRGLSEGILVTPTLVKLSPEPSKVIVGNLRERDLVVMALKLDASE